MNLGAHMCDKHLWRMCEVPTRVALCARSRVCARHDLRACKNEMKRPKFIFITLLSSYVVPKHSYVTNVFVYLVVCSRMQSYVPRMYSYVTRMLLVCTRMLLVCTRMLLECSRKLLVCSRMLLVCTRMLLVCTRMYQNMYSYVTRMLLICTRVMSQSQSK